MISIVVPVFNEERIIRKLHKRIVKVMQRQKYPYEIIFVDDGSQDGTWLKMSKLRPLKGILLQKNYGQTAALDVGIQKAKGNVIVLLDADLQNDPAEIMLLLKKIDSGYDVVVGWRQKRKDPWKRIFFSRLANTFARLILGLKIHDFGCGLKAYRSQFIKGFRLWGEAQVFLPAVAKERGAKICEIPVTHYLREIGTSKIKISKLIRGAFDLISVAFFVKYFSKPLRFFGGIGIFSLFLSILAFGAAIILRLRGILNFTDTPLPVVGTLFATLGVLLFMMGFLAEILLRIYYEIAQHSPYVIREIKENGKKR